MPALVPDVAIVAHNTDYYLLNLLNSLEPLHDASAIGDVHVWDNASSDRTLDLLAAHAAQHPWVRAQRSAVNVHHGPALDALLRGSCRSDWVLLLDADTEVVARFDAALSAHDLSDAVFAGQVHPQMPHLYAYLAHLLIHRERYAELPPFRHHGAPGVDYFRAIERGGWPYVRFRWCDYIHHFGQGSLRRIVERGERDNEFYDFAHAEEQRCPASAQRIARERELQRALDAYLAARANATRARTAPNVVAVAATRGASSTRSRDWIDDGRRWLRSPAHARDLRAATRMGLAQDEREACELMGLLRELRPRRVLEIGTAHGGSFCLWARSAAPDATLVSIDLPPWELDDPAEPDKRATIERVGSASQSVHVVRGNSHDEAVRREALACFGGQPIDFLFIDGDHSYEGVQADVSDYASQVRPGGLIALHGIHPHARGGGSEVPRFWTELRGRHRHTELIADPTGNGHGIGVVWV